MGYSEALRNRTRDFAVAVLKRVDSMPHLPSTDVAGKQLARSATAIGANYRAACRSRSKAEFVAKIHTVQEEADESQYWLELLEAVGALEKDEFDRLLSEAKELTAIFTASEKTARLGMTRTST